MPDDTAPPVLRRMAGIAADAPGGAVEPAPGLSRAWGEALMRVGAKLPALDLSVTASSCEAVATSDALALLADEALVLPMPGPNGMIAGLVALDPGLVDAVVEVQTLGRMDEARRRARVPTRIDAALARPFVASVLAEARTRLEGRELPALHPDRHLAGAVQLRREVEAPRCVVAEAGLSLGGIREVAVRLILPVTPRPAPPASGPPEANRGARSDRSPAAPAAPEATLSLGCVRLEAVLPPVSVSVTRLARLAVGDMIPLPDEALSRIELRGGRLGTGRPLPFRLGGAIPARLGQQGGRRAVKLSDPEVQIEVEAPGAQAEASPFDATTPPRAMDATGDAGTPAPTLPAAEASALPDLGDLPSMDDLPDL